MNPFPISRRRAARRMAMAGIAIACFWIPPGKLAGAETIWIPASDAAKLVGPIVLGARTGIAEDGAIGDFLVSTVCVAEQELSGGYAEFRVKIPRAAAYYVWARLRCPLGRNESFALIPEGEAPTADPDRAIGGGGSRSSAWRWASHPAGERSSSGRRAMRLDLPAGEFRFRVYPRKAIDSVFSPGGWTMARPMFNPRLNVICLTTNSDYMPSDADAERALGVRPSRFSTEALRVRSHPLPPVSAADFQRFGKKPIPDWLRCPRFYTKDAWRSELDFRKPGDIASMVRQIAAAEGNAFRMAAYWGGEAYYPSKVAPRTPGLGELDYLGEAVEEGKRLGVKIVMYANPNCFYEDHPRFEEAIIRRADGTGWGGGRYGLRGAHFICINNPVYRETLERVLTEAFTKYELDGLYVDGLTPHRCFCRYCRAKYHKMFHCEMPVEKLDGGQWTVLWEMVSRPQLVGDPNDPDTRRYTEFLYQSLVDGTRLVTETVKRARPEAVTMYHSWPKPRTLPFYDGTLTEIYIKTPWRHSLWKFGELANYSNIFPLPVLFNIYLHDHGTEAEARTKMIQGLANGCYPNCWNMLSMKPMFHFIRTNSECFDFARTSPTRFVAFPRGVRNESVQSRLLAQRGSPAQSPRARFLAPYVGMYSALVRQGLPIVTRQRSDFHKQLDGFRVLCLANEACLSDEQVRAVRQFVASGGGLVATHESSLYDEAGERRSDFGLADVLGVHFQQMAPAANRRIRFTADHPVTDGLSRERPIAHDAPHALVRLDGAKSVATLEAPGQESGAAPAVAVHQFGDGRVVYIPGRLDAIQCDQLTPEIEMLLGNAVRWVARGRVPVRLDASAPIAATLFDQPDRRVLHMVSLNGDSLYQSDRIEPAGEIAVTLEVPVGRTVRKLRRLWKNTEIRFTTSDRHIRFQLDDMGEYEVVSAELD